MTKEEKYVVNPLQKYFLDKERSGAKWRVRHRPRFGLAATGWDLQMERKNQVLLIEAKYVRGPFASALAGLVISPLTNKKEHTRSLKNKSWSSVPCWALGCGYEKGGRHKQYVMSGLYQILLDCFSRNLSFWRMYTKTTKVKYIYFVDRKKKIARIEFSKMIRHATRYKSVANKNLSERRSRAEQLLAGLEYK